MYRRQRCTDKDQIKRTLEHRSLLTLSETRCTDKDQIKRTQFS